MDYGHKSCSLTNTSMIEMMNNKENSNGNTVETRKFEAIQILHKDVRSSRREGVAHFLLSIT